jgi:hypothetical protein
MSSVHGGIEVCSDLFSASAPAKKWSAEIKRKMTKDSQTALNAG